MDNNPAGSDPVDVTVIVAAFNAEGFIQRAIASTLAQTGVAIEVLVIDDASTDGTAALVTTLAGRDSRLRLLRLPVNAGPAGARNAGIDAARGRWIAVLDADDAYAPGRLERLVGMAEAGPADLVADNFRYWEPGSGETSAPAVKRPRDGGVITLRDYLKGARPQFRDADLGLLKPVFRKAFLDAHAIRYAGRSRHGEDFLFVMDVLLAGGRFLFTRWTGYLYTSPAAGLSRTRPNHDGLIAASRALLHKPGIADDPRLAAVLRRRIAALARLARAEALRGRLGEDDAGPIGVLVRDPRHLRAVPAVATDWLRGWVRAGRRALRGQAVHRHPRTRQIDASTG